MRLVFVVPDPEATISGGNLYNLALITALREQPIEVSVVDLDGGEALLRTATRGRYLVDSLYLDALPRLRALAPKTFSLDLIVHYLPSLVTHGRVPLLSALADNERAALAAADRFVAPSDYLLRALVELGVPRERVAVVLPGSPAPVSANAREPQGGVRALMIANLVPGKGVLPLLRVLAAEPPDAPFQLTLVGNPTVDPAYAAECRSCVASSAALAAGVRFAGALAHGATLAALAASDLLISASRMESYGLALAEARALGVPIVARDGGNAAAHVDAAAGGRLCDSDEALVRELRLLAREPAQLAARRQAAETHRPQRRSWHDAANELVQLVANVRE